MHKNVILSHFVKEKATDNLIDFGISHSHGTNILIRTW